MIRNILALVIVIAIFILGLSFAVENAHDVTFNYFVGSTQWALSGFLVCAVFVGAILGALVSVYPLLRMKTQLRSLRKSQAVAKEEIRNLRTMPIKDSP